MAQKIIDNFPKNIKRKPIKIGEIELLHLRLTLVLKFESYSKGLIVDCISLQRRRLNIIKCFQKYKLKNNVFESV